VSTIMEQVARTLWVEWWSQEHQNRKEEDPDHELPWRGGDDLEQVAPPTPSEAWIDAGRLVGMVEERNGLQVDAAWARALMRDGRDWEELSAHDTEDSKREFGYYLAQAGLGSGASWMDDHEDWGLEVPTIELSYMPELFSGVRCEECREDAGPSWDNCDGCRGVVCRACRVEEVLCHCCRERSLEG
jgi:hypothetical protein